MIRSLHTLWWSLDAPGGISTGLRHLLRFRTDDVGLRLMLVHGAEFPKPGRLASLIASRGKPDRFRADLTKRALHAARPVLAERISAFKPHVLHPRDIYSCAALPEEDLPLVLHVHGPGLEEAVSSGACEPGDALARLISRLEQEAFARADLIIAVSQNEKDTLIQKGVRPDKIRVLLNATDPQWLERMASTHPSPFDFPYIFTARRLFPKNGVEVLVRAFGLMAHGLPDIRLVIAGSGPEFNAIKRVARSLGLDNRVIMLGSVAQEKVPGLLKPALAAVVPSVPHAGVKEASSHAALEAMALGVPVVASDIAGLAQLIKPGQTGLLVKAGDPQALANALERLCRDPELRAYLRANEARYVQEQRSTEAWVKALMGFYQEVLS